MLRRGLEQHRPGLELLLLSSFDGTPRVPFVGFGATPRPAHPQRTRAPLDWERARAYEDMLEGTKLDPYLRAELYFKDWPDYKLDYFRDRSNELMRRAFNDGDGPACRLLSCLQTPAAFNLYVEHLRLPREAAYGDPWNDKVLYKRWKQAIRRYFRGPCHWRRERGWNGRIHAHVLANIDDGPPELPRGGEIVKPCLHYFDEAVRYHFNPPPWTVENLASYYAVKDQGGRLPDMSGYLNVPNTRTWNNPSSSGFTFQKQLLSPDQDNLNPRNAIFTSDQECRLRIGSSLGQHL